MPHNLQEIYIYFLHRQKVKCCFYALKGKGRETLYKQFKFYVHIYIYYIIFDNVFIIYNNTCS